MDLKNLKVETEDGIAVVTVNRPELLNVLNWETTREIQRLPRSWSKIAA